MATVNEREAPPTAMDEARTAAGVALATVAMSVLLVGPRAAPFMLALLLAAIALWLPLARMTRLEGPWPHPLLAAGALGGYLLLNATWSAVPVEGLGKAALFLLVAAGAALGWRTLPAVPDDPLQRTARGLIIAFAVALGYLLLEELSGHLVKRTLFSLLPFLRPDPKHATISGEIVSRIAEYVSNRNMAMVNFVLWPVLLGCVVLVKGWRALAICAALGLAAALAMLRSQHETSVIALGLSLLVFLVARAWPRLALGLLAAGWVGSTLLVVPIVSQAYKAGLYTDKRLPMSARHRVILWGYTAEQVPRRLLQGVGIDSTKVLDARLKDRYEQPPDHNYPRRTGTHAHNIYLQTWYELGAIGAVQVLALGLALLAAIWRLEAGVRPYALAAFTVSATIAAFSWGMWQPWYMASFAISALLLLLMCELARRQPSAQ